MRTSTPSRPNILLIMVGQMRYPPFYPDDLLQPPYQILRFQGTDLAANPCGSMFAAYCMLRQSSAHRGVTQTKGVFKVGADPAVPWLSQDGAPTLGDRIRAAGYETHYFRRWGIANPPAGNLKPWGISSFSIWESSCPSDRHFGTHSLGVYRHKGYTPLVETFLKRRALGAQADIINRNNPLLPYGAPPAGTRSNPPPYPSNIGGTGRVPLNPRGFDLTGLVLPPNLPSWSAPFSTQDPTPFEGDLVEQSHDLFDGPRQDRWVAAVASGWLWRGLAENTIVVLTADHGELGGARPVGHLDGPRQALERGRAVRVRRPHDRAAEHRRPAAALPLGPELDPAVQDSMGDAKPRGRSA